MGKIIQFRPRESNAYLNISRLVEICDTVKALAFYGDAIENAKMRGDLATGEYEKLVEMFRQKRLELATPKAEPEKVVGAGVYTYTPEMGQTKPQCQMEAHRGYYGGHVYIDTPLELKGRGITFMKKYELKDFTNPDNYRVGWNEYCVTNRAYEILKSKYSISMECNLD